RRRSSDRFLYRVYLSGTGRSNQRSRARLPARAVAHDGWLSTAEISLAPRQARHRAGNVRSTARVRTRTAAGYGNYGILAEETWTNRYGDPMLLGTCARQRGKRQPG